MRKKKDEEAPPAAETRRITPLDIQQKEFRLGFRGYNERDVDEFLDEVTEAMAGLIEDNRRIREQSGFGLLGTPDPAEASRQADEIIRRAQEEAARIVAVAEATAGSGSHSGGSVDVRGIPSFLLRERDFLQGMAGMIQEHAETVREMAREARARAKEPAAPEPTAEPEPTAKPEPTAEPEPAAEPEPVAAAEPTAGSEPVAAAEPEVGEVAGGTVMLPEVAEPAPVTAEGAETSAQEHETETPQRSLRELFWGED